MPTNWVIKGVADVNGDGRADLVWRNTTNGATMVWQMKADGFRGPITFAGGVALNWELVPIEQVSQLSNRTITVTKIGSGNGTRRYN